MRLPFTSCSVVQLFMDGMGSRNYSSTLSIPYNIFKQNGSGFTFQTIIVIFFYVCLPEEPLWISHPPLSSRLPPGGVRTNSNPVRSRSHQMGKLRNNSSLEPLGALTSQERDCPPLSARAQKAPLMHKSLTWARPAAKCTLTGRFRDLRHNLGPDCTQSGH